MIDVPDWRRLARLDAILAGEIPGLPAFGARARLTRLRARAYKLAQFVLRYGGSLDQNERERFLDPVRRLYTFPGWASEDLEPEEISDLGINPVERPPWPGKRGRPVWDVESPRSQPRASPPG